MEENCPTSGHFTLHLDKALSCSIDKAVWNPEKDLLAMVTKDQQLILHRFNWQRLWAVSPEKKVTSLCWRPDGKALAVGHEDGTISLHDVENGNVFRQTVTHHCAIECLTWVEEMQALQNIAEDAFSYEDRTSRFFPPPPKAPTMPGAAPAFEISGVVGSLEEQNNSADAKAVPNSSHQRINILCSGDRNGTVCLNIFGVFLIGRVEVGQLELSTNGVDGCKEGNIFRLLDAYILKATLSENLRELTVLCSGQLVTSCPDKGKEEKQSGLFCLQINSALVGCRRKELHQIALQVSSIEELLEVLQLSMNVMQKLWVDAISSFQEKFQCLPQMLDEHGSHAKPQEELLSLLSCGLASSGVHQFLAVSLGEGGLKRLSKTMDTALREIHLVISEHLQPVAEIVAFRVGELRGIARWRARSKSIGLEEKLVDQAMEDAGMLLVQVERILRLVFNTAAQFRMFFVWLMKSLRQLNNESSPSSDQLPSIDSEAIVIFLKTQFEADLLAPHLAPVSADAARIEINIEESERLEELALMGGFLDSTFLHKSLNQQISQLFLSCQEAFSMPSKIVSKQLKFETFLLLGQFHRPYSFLPISLAYYKDKGNTVSQEAPRYICFLLPTKVSEEHGVVGIVRECLEDPLASSSEVKCQEVVALRVGSGLSCIDLSLYKEKQLVLLGHSICSAQAWLTILPIDSLPYKKITQNVPFKGEDLLNWCLSNDSVVHISLNNGRARTLLYGDVVPPLAVSASRGLACVFARQRRALLYDLEEDEDGQDTEMD